MSGLRKAPGDVAITGMGFVSPLGLTADEISGACSLGKSAIGPVSRIDGLAGMSLMGAQAPEFNIEGHLRFPKNSKFMKRAVACAVLASGDAVADSGIKWNTVDPERIALFTASGQTNIEYDIFFPALEAAWKDDREADFKYLGQKEARMIDRYFSLRTLANLGIALISIERGIRGTASNHAQGDAAFASALQTAHFDLVDRRCDVALVGAYDCLLTASNVLAFAEAGLLSAGCYRPFDRHRSGIVLGEAAAFFLLERLDDALNRRARILASIMGIGVVHDCSQDPAIGWRPGDLNSVIAAAGIHPDECHYAVAHGFGTPHADLSESLAWSAAGFDHLPVTAFKGLTGYAGAAAGALDLSMGIICSRAGFVPQVAGLESEDPEISLNLVRGSPYRLSAPNPAGLFIAKSLTGQVSAIAVRRW